LKLDRGRRCQERVDWDGEKGGEWEGEGGRQSEDVKILAAKEDSLF
jgi:hypothetical protein